MNLKTHIQRWYKALAAFAVWAYTMGFTGLAEAQIVVKRGSGYGPPVDASVDGHRIDSLIYVTNIFITILFVIMVIWLVWAVFAHNEKHEAEYDHGDSKGHIWTALGISAIIFVVVDGNLFYHAATDLTEVFWNYDKALSDPQHVKIEINARQWIWQARYAGPDKKFNTEDDAIATNDIRIPVNDPVIVQIGSPDVIHNFNLPNFRVKMDAVPGSINQMWFRAKETGSWEIGCAQHCGAAHYLMRGVLTAMPRAEFEEWVASMSRDSAQIYDAKDTEANWGWAWRKI